MVGEWVTIIGPLAEAYLTRVGDEPLQRTEIIYLPSGDGAKVTLRVEKVALHWRVVDHTFAGPVTGPALEGLERFPTRDAARQAADEWLAAWRARLLLGCPK